MEKDQLKDKLIQFLYLNRKKIFGTLLGLFVGILILLIGFFKTLLLVITTIIGYYCGLRWNLEEDLKNLIFKVIPEKFK